MAHLISHLRHIALGVPNLAEERTFFTDIWGLTEVAADGEVVYLAAEGSTEPFIVRLRQTETKRIDLISLGAPDRASVDQLATNVAKAGAHVVSEPGAMQGPGGGYGCRFFDNEGRTVEVTTEVSLRAARVLAPGEAVPKSLSHVVLNSAVPEASVAFWTEVLGFRLSDQLTMHAQNLMWFLRCNAKHHSVAFARAPHASLHHASFDMRGVDEYMYATGRAKRAGVEFLWGPGRHLAGLNTFSYFLDPAGNTVEFTTDLEEVDDEAWESHVYSIEDPRVADQWGTANAMSGEIAMKSWNSPDAGLFVAPPR